MLWRDITCDVNYGKNKKASQDEQFGKVEIPQRLFGGAQDVKAKIPSLPAQAQGRGSLPALPLAEQIGRNTEK